MLIKMCDLIDLNSSDTNKGLRTELASPLIPPPAGSGSDEPTRVTNGLPNLMADEKRSSLDNNPFDQVFKETAEYVRKREDPFEMVLEKVSSSKKSKRHSIEFKDDFIPKHTRHAEVLKINKTLDDSLLDIDLNTSSICFAENSILEDLNNTDLLGENPKHEDLSRIPIQVSSPGGTSILNYSAMNDSLTGHESKTKAKETAIRSLVAHRVSMCIQKGILEAEGMLNPNQHPKLKNKRSLSQTDRLSPKKFYFKQRSHSIMDTRRKISRSDRSTLSSMPSIEFDDQMNKGFLQEQYSADNSVFSDLSNFSEITRLASISSAYNSSTSLFSNETLNQAFLRSGSSSTSQNFSAITLSPANFPKNFRSSSASTTSSLNASDVKIDISDLRERFKALKLKLSQSSSSDSDNTKKDITELSEKFKELKCMSENRLSETTSKFESQVTTEKDDKNEEKLIDVEIFVPSSESSSLRSKSSFSDNSSDCVFTKIGADKSILSEARKLAKTFEEMADDKTSSLSECDLSSHTRPDFDELPDSEDEVVVDNLIDLPPSPLKPEAPPNSPIEVESESPPSDESLEEKSKIKMKDIEMEFVEPKDPEKRIMTTSLFMDLENLVKTQQNPNAEKLLNELEKVLGVKWKNNTELLGTYLQTAKSNMQIDKVGQDGGQQNKDLEKKDIKKIDIENKDGSKSNKEDKYNESSDDKEGFTRGTSFVIKKGRQDFRKMQYPGLNKSISRRSLDSTSKVKSSLEKSVQENWSVSQVTITNNTQSSKEKRKSQLLTVRKRFSSDPNFVNPILEKKQVDSTTSMRKSVSSKELQAKVTPPPKIQKSLISSMADAVRNKFKHKYETGVSKRGPMKATIPFGNMQRQEEIEKKFTSMKEPQTPTKTSEAPPVFTVTSSTPNSLIKPILFKKSKSKPVASSTPDYKEPRTPIIKPPSPRKRNFSCNISPVPTLSKSSQEKCNSNGSPKGNKINAFPKRSSTPKARKPPSTLSGIPKFSPRPEMQRRRSLNDLNKSAVCSESPQFHPTGLQKTPISAKRVERKTPQSPLRNSNKIDCLISKMRIRGNKYTEAEKENYS